MKSPRIARWSLNETCCLLEVWKSCPVASWDVKTLLHNERYGTERGPQACGPRFVKLFGTTAKLTDAMIEKKLRELKDLPAVAESGPEVVMLSDDDDDEDGGNEGEADEDDYEVESILSHGMSSSENGTHVMLFEVKWKGFDETTWEPAEKFGNPGTVLNYMERAGLDASASKRKTARRAGPGSKEQRASSNDLPRAVSPTTAVSRPVALTHTLSKDAAKIQKLEQQLKGLEQQLEAGRYRQMNMQRESQEMKKKHAAQIRKLNEQHAAEVAELRISVQRNEEPQQQPYRSCSLERSIPDQAELAGIESPLLTKLRGELQASQDALQLAVIAGSPALMDVFQDMVAKLEALRDERDALSGVKSEWKIALEKEDSLVGRG